MRVATLYDIHGNLPALEAVLQELKTLKVDLILVGGDVVLGPMSRQCLDKLLSLKMPKQFILGNCEVSVLAEMTNGDPGKLPETVLEDIRWTANQLSSTHQKLMSKWPKTIKLEIERLGEILFCHATPRSENENFTRLTPEEKLLSVFEAVDSNIVVCGHTHMQFDRLVGSIRIINAGSVGMPFGQPGAYWLLLGPGGVELRRTAYDLNQAVDRILNTDYPHAADFAQKNVLDPPSEELMIGLFGKAGLE